MSDYSYDRSQTKKASSLPTTASLARMTLKARSNGSLQESVVSAGFYAKKMNQTMFVYQGTSFMHLVWRVSSKPGEYLDPINNTGEKMLSVTPDLSVAWHDIKRADP